MSQSDIYKIILLGNQAVGKTSLLERYVNNTHTSLYRATLGANFLSKKLKFNESNVTLQIWDTAGQEVFQSLGTAFYRGSDACIFVFDLTSTKTFESLASWREEFLFQQSYPTNFPFLVIGNKADLGDKRVVSALKAKKWCDEHDIQYFECSAKDGTNVAQAFEVLLTNIVQYWKINQRRFTPSMQLTKKIIKKKKCKC